MKKVSFTLREAETQLTLLSKKYGDQNECQINLSSLEIAQFLNNLPLCDVPISFKERIIEEFLPQFHKSLDLIIKK